MNYWEMLRFIYSNLFAMCTFHKLSCSVNTFYFNNTLHSTILVKLALFVRWRLQTDPSALLNIL